MKISEVYYYDNSFSAYKGEKGENMEMCWKEIQN